MEMESTYLIDLITRYLAGEASGDDLVFLEAWLKADPGNRKVFEDYRKIWLGMEQVRMEDNLKIIREAGYEEVDHFILPESSWWEFYYHPMEKRIGLLRQKYKGDEAANKQLDENQQEIEMYRRYSSWYGYVFYVMQVR